MTLPSEAMDRLEIELPEPAQPAFNYVPAVVHAEQILVSGQLPKEGGEVQIHGRLGGDVDQEEGRKAARLCVLQGLAVAAAAAGGLDRIERVLRVTGYVASEPNFYEQPRIVDAASDLLGEVFGEYGRHARSAVGVTALPRNAPVELEFIFALRQGEQG
jgi:enamine deaminase RidA (YjgF/YER057c/UK114 family)